MNLQYPKSIAQAVSLVETTELVVKASRHLATKGGNLVRQRAQISQIGAEANGEVHQVVAEVEAVVTMDQGVEGQVVEAHQEDVVVDHQGLIH